jgi:hypothetical protein
MNDDTVKNRVIGASLGFGTIAAHDALKRAKSSATSDEKIAHLTEAVEILLAHVDYVEDAKSRDAMNREIGNIYEPPR